MFSCFSTLWHEPWDTVMNQPNLYIHMELLLYFLISLKSNVFFCFEVFVSWITQMHRRLNPFRLLFEQKTILTMNHLMLILFLASTPHRDLEFFCFVFVFGSTFMLDVVVKARTVSLSGQTKIKLTVDIQSGKLMAIKPTKMVLNDTNVFAHDKSSYYSSFWFSLYIFFHLTLCPSFVHAVL